MFNLGAIKLEISSNEKLISFKFKFKISSIEKLISFKFKLVNKGFLQVSGTSSR